MHRMEEADCRAIKRLGNMRRSRDEKDFFVNQRESVEPVLTGESSLKSSRGKIGSNQGFALPASVFCDEKWESVDHCITYENPGGL